MTKLVVISILWVNTDEFVFLTIPTLNLLQEFLLLSLRIADNKLAASMGFIPRKR
jgi:hypothetical protein